MPDFFKSQDLLDPAERLAWTFALLSFPPGRSWSTMPYFAMGAIHAAAQHGRPHVRQDWKERGDEWQQAGFTPTTYELLNSAVNTVGPRLLSEGRATEEQLAAFGLREGRVGWKRGCLYVSQWGAFPDRVGREMTSRIVEEILLGLPVGTHSP